MVNLVVFRLGHVLYKLADSGIANALGLETLRHGTNPLSNLLIRIFGGNPRFGEAPGGSTKDWCQCKSENYFYLFKDSEFLLSKSLKPLDNIALLRILPRFHAALSGYNLTNRFLAGKNLTQLPLIIRVPAVFFNCLGGALSVLISPTLRFRFSEIDSSRLENDSDYYQAAYRTGKRVEAWRIGMTGSFLTGLNFDWYARAKSKPLKVLTGVIQLGCAFAIASRVKELVIANPYSFLAGALLA